MKKIFLTLEIPDDTLGAQFEKRFERCHINSTCMKCMKDYLNFQEKLNKTAIPKYIKNEK